MGSVRTVVTLAIGVAVIALVLLRPRGLSEAWWTVLGAVAVVAIGAVTPAEALAVLFDGRDALLFLLALLLLSLLVAKSGFFEWAAIHCARWARGDVRALQRNVLVLGACVTATLSLDTTAVMLTPVVLALVRRVRLPAVPFVILSALVANVGSLLFPVSNLTNILFADTFGFTFTTFVARTALPQIAALLALGAYLRWQLSDRLPPRFSDDDLPDAASTVPDRAYFRACIGALLVAFVGYFVAPSLGVPAWAVAFACSAALLAAGLATGRVAVGAWREISWDVFPFVAGLFITVRAIEQMGLGTALAGWLTQVPEGSPWRLGIISVGTGLAANVMNNLPAALLARGVLVTAGAGADDAIAALVGADLGPIVTPLGSLATMLVLMLARRAGVVVPARDVVTIGARAALVTVVSATLVLTVVAWVAR